MTNNSRFFFKSQKVSVTKKECLFCIVQRITHTDISSLQSSVDKNKTHNTRLKSWPNRLTSRRKSTKDCKTRTCVQTCEGCGQMDSQVGSQVAKSRKFHAYNWLMRFYNNRLLAINLCRLALGGQTVKNLHLLASKFELDQSQRKSMQVDAFSRCKWVAKRNTS